MSGLCTASLIAIADPAQTVVFDAVDFQRQFSVTSGSKKIKHDYDNRPHTIHWPQPVRRGERIEVKIQYRVTKPKLGLHFIGPDRHYPTKPVQVWTQGEDEYNRYWFPCHDAPQERMTTEMIVTVPAPYTAISNGALIKAAKKGRNRVFHWKQNVPHSPYLVSLVVGQFSEIKDRWKKVPVLYYCTPGREGDTKRAFGKTPKMIEFFSSKLGRSLCVCEIFAGGGR